MQKHFKKGTAESKKAPTGRQSPPHVWSSAGIRFPTKNRNASFCIYFFQLVHLLTKMKIAVVPHYTSLTVSPSHHF